MKIIAADDEALALELLSQSIKEVAPEAIVFEFTKASELLEFAKDTPCDIAFLDINMSGVTGIQIGKQLKKWWPQINIIFVTGYEEYSLDAIQMHASGYILKPVTSEHVKAEIENLRNPVVLNKSKVMKIKCFGNFDVYTMNDTMISFQRSKAKEVLAYLVYKSGASCTIKEIAAVIFDDKEYDKKLQGYMQKIISSMMLSLKDVGVETIIRKAYNSLSINPDLVDCDYYRFLDSNEEASKTYRGEFLSQYSWAETALGYLEKIYWRNKG